MHVIQQWHPTAKGTKASTSIQSQLDPTILGQKVSVRTEVDVLNVQQLFYSTRCDLARAHYSLLIAKPRLEAEPGKPDEVINTILR
jgi:outer membrane protein